MNPDAEGCHEPIDPCEVDPSLPECKRKIRETAPMVGMKVMRGNYSEDENIDESDEGTDEGDDGAEEGDVGSDENTGADDGGNTGATNKPESLLQKYRKQLRIIKLFSIVL